MRLARVCRPWECAVPDSHHGARLCAVHVFCAWLRVALFLPAAFSHPCSGTNLNTSHVSALRYCIKPLIGGLPQPATMRLLLEQRKMWGEPEGPPHVPLVAQRDSRGPAFGVIEGQWRPYERSDGPFWVRGKSS